MNGLEKGGPREYMCMSGEGRMLYELGGNEGGRV